MVPPSEKASRSLKINSIERFTIETWFDFFGVLSAKVVEINSSLTQRDAKYNQDPTG